MDFELSEEQRLLKQTCERYFADHYQFESRKRYAHEPRGWSLIAWKQYADLGLLGVPFAEEHGGTGGGPVETMIIMEQIGRVLLLEPYLATVVLGGGFVARGGSDAQRADLLPKIAAGERSLAFAHAERQARYDLADVATSARRDGSGYVLDGAKTLVAHGGGADRLIIPARVGGERTDTDGIALFLLDAQAPGLSRHDYATQDGLRAADLVLNGVRADDADVLGPAGAGGAALARVIDEGIAALCAEAVGAMSALQEMTLEYLKTRQQFGVAIGQFQALQHRAVEMFVVLEQARSMALYAALSVSDDRPAERRRALCAAKAHIGRAARHIGQEAIQLHGGLGMTLDYAAGRYFRRLTMIDLTFGSQHDHISELAKSGGLEQGSV